MTTTDRHVNDVALPEGVEFAPVPRMPPASLGVRVKTSPALRALLPTRLVVARAERKARRLWREHEPTRAYALRTMEAVVAGTPREGELEEIAREWVVESLAWEALFWQPWSLPRTDAATRDRLMRACSGERGVVVSACHLGPYFRKAKTLMSLGIEPYVVAGDWYFEQPSSDYWGRRLARWRRGVPRVPFVRARGSFPILASLLARGATVLVYYDMPGGHETRFLGKPVALVDGTARLAVEADALVVPLRSKREGHRLRLQAFEPLDPRDFSGVEELHCGLARIHERLILEYPAALADPAEYGWAQGATAAGWRRPQRSGAAELQPPG